MVNRRDFLGITLGAGATLTLTPELLRALQVVQRQGGKLLQRAIPSTGEMLPVVSFGARATEPAAFRQVLKTFVDNGGKVLDTMHGGPEGEQAAGAAASALGIQGKLFWTTSLAVVVPTLPGYAGPPPKVNPAAVREQIESKLALFKVPKIDVFQIASGGDIQTHLSVLREMKKAGKVRYIGVSELSPPPQFKNVPFLVQLEAVMRNEPIDFIGIDYSVGDRRVEERILPLAQERKIGVMAYFPFDRSRIFERASSTPLPEWASEFDAKTWAQFFLKYVVSHPAVTVARTGTTNPAHMLDDIAGGIGRLPDEAMRKRMAQLVDSLPATRAAAAPPPPPPAQQGPPIVVPAAILDRYVGEYLYAAAGQTVTFRRDGDRLLVKISGSMPEGPLVARSETRFGAPWGATIDFQLDGQGKVTGAVIEQGPFHIPLERK